MTIYLDYIFIENFLIDYILLKETSYIARKELNTKRTIISAFVGSIYVVMMLYLKIEEWNFLISKILLAGIIVYISFKPTRTKEYLKLVMLFFMVSVINVGTLTVIATLLSLNEISALLKIGIYVTSLIFSDLFMKQMWKVYKSEIKNDDLIYTVRFCLNGKVYEYKAFLDTGNNVYSYVYDVPVVFAEIQDVEILKWLSTKQSFDITTVTLACKSSKKAYIFDEVEIIKKGVSYHVKAAIVFEENKLSKDNSYNMLLNYILYTQNLGGIKI